MRRAAGAALKGLLGLILAWVLLVAVIMTPAVNVAVPQLVQQSLGKTLKHGILLIDPFRLRVTGESFTLLDDDGLTRIHLRDLSIDINAWSSLRQQRLMIEAVVLSGFEWRNRRPSSHPVSPALLWQSLALSDLSVDMAGQAITAETLEVTAPGLRASMIDGAVNLAHLWVDLVPKTTDAEPVTDESSRWRLALNKAEATDGQMDLRLDLIAGPGLRTNDLTIELADFSWPQGGVGRLGLSAGFSEGPQINLRGQLNWDDGSGVIEADWQGLPVPWFQPMADPYVAARLDNGLLAGTVTTQLRGLAPASVSADISLDHLQITPTGIDEPVTSLAQLAVDGLTLDLDQHRARIDGVTLSGVQTLLHIDDAGELTLLQMIRRNTDDLPETAVAADPTVPWRFALGEAQLLDSTVDFRDDNLPVQFTAHIEQLNGALTGFDTAIDSTAEWQAEGVIEGYAPVSMEGRLGHFSAPRNGHFMLRTRGVDLATLAPYSATYAGYPIEQGVMELALDYALEEGGVVGNNSVRVEQLALGDRVDSDRQMIDLPLRTAVALLSDAAGVIDVSLDVSGSLEDPEFDVWGAAGRAAMTLIRNAVTAPFRFLASLVGSSESLDRVVFTTGQPSLAPEAAQILVDLGTALTQRPAIQVSIEPGIDPIGDRQALAAETLNRAVTQLGLGADAMSARGEAWHVALVTLAGEAGLPTDQVTDALYASLLAYYNPPDAALEALARARAAAVKQRLVDAGGIDPQRIAVSPWRGIDSPQESIAQLSLAPR